MGVIFTGSTSRTRMIARWSRRGHNPPSFPPSLLPSLLPSLPHLLVLVIDLGEFLGAIGEVPRVDTDLLHRLCGREGGREGGKGEKVDKL